MLRLAFWLAVVVYMLPSDPQQQARLHAIVMSALGRVNTYCDSNSRSCGAGNELWVTIVKKAEFGLRLVGDIISGGGGRTPRGEPGLYDRRWNGRPDPHRPRVPPEEDYRPRRGPGPVDE